MRRVRKTNKKSGLQLAMSKVHACVHVPYGRYNRIYLFNYRSFSGEATSPSWISVLTKPTGIQHYIFRPWYLFSSVKSEQYLVASS